MTRINYSGLANSSRGGWMTRLLATLKARIKSEIPWLNSSTARSSHTILPRTQQVSHGLLFQIRYNISSHNRSATSNWCQVTINFGGSNDLRWKIADSSRIYQDEYLEWSLSRDKNGNITTVVFTCEGPEASQPFCYSYSTFSSFARI